MMDNIEEDDPDVWKVSQLEEFLYFCCPNCDVKEKSKELFVKHALDHHPKARIHLESLICKVEFCKDEETTDTNFNGNGNEGKLFFALRHGSCTSARSL